MDRVRKAVEQAWLYWDRMNEWTGTVPTKEDVIDTASRFLAEDTGMSYEEARRLVENVLKEVA